MSYQEAVEDNIPRSGNGIKGQGYYPPCHICGTPVYSWAYRRGTVYTCPDCRKELVAQERAEKDSLRAPAKERKLEEADELKRQVQDEITRALASGSSYAKIARSITDYGEASFRRSARIARTAHAIATTTNT